LVALNQASLAGKLRAGQLRTSDDMAYERITVDPDKLGGQPCIRGMRFSVAQLVRLVAAGWDLERIQEECPFIEAEDVEQALQYEAASSEVTMMPLQESA
jgi:uncharacterized protein (DUF433 family)